MEITLIIFSIAFILLVAFYIMRDSDETRRRKEFAAQRIARMLCEREAQATAEYERLRARHTHSTPSRSAPVTTGKPVSGSRPAPQVSRRDNSFDTDIDTYTAPMYHSSHSSGSYSSHSCSSSSSSSSDSSSSSSDSGGGGCD